MKQLETSTIKKEEIRALYLSLLNDIKRGSNSGNVTSRFFWSSYFLGSFHSVLYLIPASYKEIEEAKNKLIKLHPTIDKTDEVIKIIEELVEALSD